MESSLKNYQHIKNTSNVSSNNFALLYIYVKHQNTNAKLFMYFSMYFNIMYRAGAIAQ